MHETLKQLDSLRVNVEELRKRHRHVWFSMNNPFGWEVLEIRYGGLLPRLETFEYRIGQWIEGIICKIEELEAERLYFDGPYKMPKGTVGRNIYRRIVTVRDLG